MLKCIDRNSVLVFGADSDRFLQEKIELAKKKIAKSFSHEKNQLYGMKWMQQKEIPCLLKPTVIYLHKHKDLVFGVVTHSLNLKKISLSGMMQNRCIYAISMLVEHSTIM